MDYFERTEAVNQMDNFFWKKALQSHGAKPTSRHVKRLKRHFLAWWSSEKLGDFMFAWSRYTSDPQFFEFIQACKNGHLSRSEIYNLLRDGFGVIGVYKKAYAQEIRKVMEPLVSLGLVEHRVVRGGGHYWQPEDYKNLEFDSYLSMLTDTFIKRINNPQNQPA